MNPSVTREMKVTKFEETLANSLIIRVDDQFPWG